MPEPTRQNLSFEAYLRDTFARPTNIAGAAAWVLFILVTALKRQLWLVLLLIVVAFIAIAVDYFTWRRPNSRRTRRP